MRKLLTLALSIILFFASESALLAHGSPEEVLSNQVISSSALTQSSETRTQDEDAQAEDDKVSFYIEKLLRLFRFVDENFYEDIDYKKAYENMATALFESLDDKYSYYVMEDDKAEYIENSMGTYGGIGLYFSKNHLQYQDTEDPATLYCVVDRVFPNTPCSRAGLRSDDYIIAIDGEDVTNLEATECASRMKGEPGTHVTITVKRGNLVFDLNLTREIVTVPTVEYTTIDNGTIGYIRITEFTSSTWEKVVEALVEYEMNRIRKIIIDLRSNGGGDINVALSIADAFISNGELLKISQKDAEPESYYARRLVLVKPEVKVAILVNGQSASSSEILTGAMKDNNRAVIIGTRTYGKGIMQVVTPFDEGYVSLTNASFTTPGRERIHETGIEPDIEVPELEMTDDEAEIYTNVYNDRVIPQYVNAHPEFTDENIEAFSLDAEKYGEIRHEILRVLVRYEYINRLPGDKQFIIDPAYDEGLSTAIDYLNGVQK